MLVITKKYKPGKYRGSKVVKGKTFFLVEWSNLTDCYCDFHTQWIQKELCTLKTEYPKWFVNLKKRFSKQGKRKKF